MAKIRTIRPEFWTDEKVVELSYAARLVFIGLWNLADDFGLMEYSPKRIKMQILPADSAEIEGIMAEISGQGLVTLYNAANKGFLAINNFTKHQKIDKRTATKFPPPPDLSEAPPISAEKVLGKERKGKERKGKEENTPLPPEPQNERAEGNVFFDKNLETLENEIINESPPPEPVTPKLKPDHNGWAEGFDRFGGLTRQRRRFRTALELWPRERTANADKAHAQWLTHASDLKTLLPCEKREAHLLEQAERYAKKQRGDGVEPRFWKQFVNWLTDNPVDDDYGQSADDAMLAALRSAEAEMKNQPKPKGVARAS